MKVKICGITNREDAENAISLGVTSLGFIFYQKSPRYITPEAVKEIVMFLPPFVSTVGVFVNEEADRVNEIASDCKLDYVQLHGEESSDYCMQMSQKIIKAIRVERIEDLSIINQFQGIVNGLLLDSKIKGTYGGTGKVFDWGIALTAKDFDIPLILSGGINQHNIVKALQLVNPYAVDISSGVESEPGKKDYQKMRELIEEINTI